MKIRIIYILFPLFLTGRNKAIIIFNSSIVFILKRYKCFTLFELIDNDKYKSCGYNSINLARHLTIEGRLQTAKYSIQFPCVTKLTLKDNHIDENPLFMNNVNSLVSLTRIIDLNVINSQLSITQLIEILSVLPNLQSLTLPNALSFSSKRNLNIHLLSRNNQIRKVIIDDDECEIEHVQFLIQIFSRLQCLEIGVNENKLEQILQFLLTKSEYLFSLFLMNTNWKVIENIRKLIKKKNLLHDYTIEHIHGGLHLWW